MATGRAFEFSSLENRQSSEINRTYGQMQQANQNAAAARAQEGSAISSGMNALGGAIGSGAFGGGGAKTTGFTGSSANILESAGIKNYGASDNAFSNIDTDISLNYLPPK
jgi:hypothetical protein